MKPTLILLLLTLSISSNAKVTHNDYLAHSSLNKFGQERLLEAVDISGILYTEVVKGENVHFVKEEMMSKDNFDLAAAITCCGSKNIIQALLCAPFIIKNSCLSQLGCRWKC